MSLLSHGEGTNLRDCTSSIELTTRAVGAIELGSMITFDAVAEDYDRTVESSIPWFGTNIAFFHRNKIHHLVRVARHAGIDLPAARVLDVGCGTGGTDRMLRPMVGRLAGMDVSKKMVAHAKAISDDIDHRTYDGHTLPFEPGTFDIAFAFNVMHHVPSENWGLFAAQMFTAVRSGGLCVIIEHNPLNPVTRKSVRNCPFDAEAVLVRPADLDRVFGQIGGDLIAKWYVLFAPLGGRRTFRAEQLLSWLPLGGQYLYAVRRP
jgi:SAM-dependent methyltransferase